MTFRKNTFAHFMFDKKSNQKVQHQQILSNTLNSRQLQKSINPPHLHNHIIEEKGVCLFFSICDTKKYDTCALYKKKKKLRNMINFLLLFLKIL